MPALSGIEGIIELRSRLFGGIVANTDQRNYQGRWICFDKTNRDLEKVIK